MGSFDNISLECIHKHKQSGNHSLNQFYKIGNRFSWELEPRFWVGSVLDMKEIWCAPCLSFQPPILQPPSSYLGRLVGHKLWVFPGPNARQIPPGLFQHQLGKHTRSPLLSSDDFELMLAIDFLDSFRYKPLKSLRIVLETISPHQWMWNLVLTLLEGQRYNGKKAR